ncbi:hypothetical protein CFC21_073758, partial [Triticum aestivum]
MTGVQVMPGVGAVTTVAVRGLRGGAWGWGAARAQACFAGDWRRSPRRVTCSVRLKQCGRD